MPSSLILEPIKLKMMLKTILSFYKQIFLRGIGYGVLAGIPIFLYVALFGIDSLSNYNTLAGVPLFITSLMSLFLFNLSFAAISKVTSQLYLEQPVDWNSANKDVISSAWKFSGVFFASIFWMALKSLLPAIVSFIAFSEVMRMFNIQDINSAIFLLAIFAIPTVLIYILTYINYALVIPVVSEEDTQINESLNRSRNLVSGNRCRVFAYIAFFIALPFVINFALGLILGALLVNFMSLDPQTIALISFAIDNIVRFSLWMLSPIMITLLYFDLLARKIAIQKKLQVVEVEIPIAEE